MKMPLSYTVWNRYVIQHCGNSAANNVLNTVRYAHSDGAKRRRLAWRYVSQRIDTSICVNGAARHSEGEQRNARFKELKLTSHRTGLAGGFVHFSGIKCSWR